MPPPVIVAPAQYAPKTTRKPLTLSTHRPEWVSITRRKREKVLLSRHSRSRHLMRGSSADCNRREPGGILGGGEQLGWDIAMAVKIDRIQPAGMNVRMQQGKPAYSHVVTVTGPTKMIYIAGQLARDGDGNIVGPGDMRAQLEQRDDRGGRVN